MWRNKPEWDEAQRRLKGEAAARTTHGSPLNEDLIDQFVRVGTNAPRVLVVEQDVNYVPATSPIPLMNPAIIDRAIATWGEEKQYTQFMEECGEAITEICHMFFRPDRTIPLDKLLEEIVGVRIAVDHVIRLNEERCREIYYDQINKEISAMDRVAERKEILANWGCPT